MSRFLPMNVYQRTVLNDRFWASLINTQQMLLGRSKEIIEGNGKSDEWKL